MRQFFLLEYCRISATRISYFIFHDRKQERNGIRKCFIAVVPVQMANYAALIEVELSGDEMHSKKKKTTKNRIIA